ncbi:MAG: DUF1330 domain-containing protein [Pseudomonadota bacterium]
MKAFVIVQEEVVDQATFDAYRKDVLSTIEAFGGRFLVRGGRLAKLEGTGPSAGSPSSSFLHGWPPRVGTGPPPAARPSQWICRNSRTSGPPWPVATIAFMVVGILASPFPSVPIGPREPD